MYGFGGRRARGLEFGCPPNYNLGRKVWSPVTASQGFPSKMWVQDSGPKLRMLIISRPQIPSMYTILQPDNTTQNSQLDCQNNLYGDGMSRALELAGQTHVSHY